MKNERARYEKKAKVLINLFFNDEDAAEELTTEEIRNEYVVGQAIELTRMCVKEEKEVSLKNLLYFVTWEDELCNLEEELEKLFEGFDFSSINEVISTRRAL